MARSSSIASRMFWRTIIVISVSVLLLGTIWLWREVRYYRESIRSTREEFLSDTRNTLKQHVVDAIGFVEYKKQQTEELTRQMIRDRANEAYSISMGLYETYRNELPLSRIKEMVRETLRSVRFNDGRGYFFATDLDGVEQLFADRPELEGENLIDMRDSRGAYVISDMIEIIRESGEGYYSYYWTKPGAEGNEHRKLSYIKLLPPFDWFVGTGEYLEDVEAIQKHDAIEWIQRISFGNGGYVFAGQWDGLSLSGPAAGSNMLEVTDIDGVRIVQELIRYARSGGGFLTYVMPGLDGQRSAPKLSYAAGVPEWEWYVGAGVYIDEIDSVVDELQRDLYRVLKWNVLSLLLILVCVWLAVYFVERGFSRSLDSAFERFDRFFARAAEDLGSIPDEEFKFVEFRSLARSAKNMIARRLQAEETLRASEATANALLNAPRETAMLVSADGIVMACNAIGARRFGVGIRTLVGTRIYDWVPEDVAELYRRNLKSAVETRAVVAFTVENESRYSETYLYPVHDPGNDINEVALFSRDVTSRINSERERTRLEEQLRQSQKMEAIGQLTGGVAHDFNNILQVINGYTDMLLTDHADGKRDSAALDESLREIAKAGERGSQLVEQLLFFSRKQLMRPEVLDLSVVVAELLVMIRRIIGEHIRLEWSAAGLEQRIEADRGMIEQVLMNLCVNARDAMPAGGCLSIRIAAARRTRAPQAEESAGNFERTGEYVVLSVADTGVGMDTDTRSHMFEPFYTTKKKGKGTGLGLSTVYGIVQQHHGFIEVVTAQGEGTEFKVYWPVLPKSRRADATLIC